jgi:D-alanine-D-alanine ligase
MIRTPQDLQAVCANLLATYSQPVLVETFLPGREFTVGIVGTGLQARSLGIMEVLLEQEAEPEVYSYANKAYYETRVRYRLVDDPAAQMAATVALQAWRCLGCRDGGRVDLRCTTTGTPQFLEVNPLAGLHPVHSDLPILCRLAGMPYDTLIDIIMTSAAARLTPTGSPAADWLLPAGDPASLALGVL